MRNTLKFLLLVMLTASLASCELLNVDIKTNIEGQMSLVSDQTELKSTEDYGISGSVTIDITDNDELEPYADLIVAIETRSVSLLVTAIDSSGVVIRDGAEFSISTPTNSGLTWPISPDWPIEVGTTINLTAENYDVLNTMLEGDEPVTLSSTGSCNKGNVHISLTYDIEVVVEASPL